MRKVVTLAVVLVVGTLVTFGTAQAGDRIHREFDIPATLSASIQATACGGAPGPQVSVQADLTLSGLNAEVIFRNTGPKISQQPIVLEQVVVPPDQQVSTPAQSIVGGIGSNPYIWLQILDAKGRPLTSEMFLGRCDQGTFTVTPNFAVPATAIADVTATSCGASQGPAVTLDGATEITGLTGRLIFRSSNAFQPAGKTDQSVSELVIMPAGQSFAFPAQPVIGNSNTNPQVGVQFRQADGIAVGSEVRLGLCSSLTAQ